MHGEQKALLRTDLTAARRARAPGELDAARRAIQSAVLARCAQACWRCVAAYEPLPTEPGSRQLLAGLHGEGVSVIVPTLLADNDLDWRHWHPDPAWPCPALGVEAIALADAVLVPALAVAADGTRLGRGGGSYDRALARAAKVDVAALVFEEEFVGALPTDVWDRQVTAVVTPSGWRDLPG
ncbi:MAG: 5-formyltetrahydrofolate cyclo-ligase [Actinomycetota bacterium]|nr:5-formyltetrahydrofolate cyclo-ligase [Actinomycetota bacterium]